MGFFKSRKKIFLVLGLVIVFGGFVGLFLKNRMARASSSDPQVQGDSIVQDPTLSPIPTDTPSSTPTDSPTDEPTDAPQTTSPTDTSQPTTAPSATATPTPTPTPTSTPETYQASISVSPSGTVPADGTSLFTITVNVTNQSNEGKGGVTVNLTSDPNVVFNLTSSDANGNYIFTAASQVPGTYTFNVLVYHNSVTTTGTNTLTFGPTATPTPTP